MKYIYWIVLCLVVNPILMPAQTPTSSKPKVLIITTGGTIASVNGKPMIDGPALVQAVPTLKEYAEIEVVAFSKIGSSQMTPDHWLRLGKSINEYLQKDKDLTGIVITHGTDTMEETAFFLNLTVRSKKPIVVVGAMRSSNEISADGPANLLNAVRVVIDEQAIGQGVLVVLNEHIAAARNVYKTHNRNVHTFQSPELGYLGFVDPDAIKIYQQVMHPHTYQTEFDLSHMNQLPIVEIVQDFTGFDESILEYFLNKGVDGLIIQTFAGGRMSAGMRKGLAKVKSNQLPIVITSSVLNGRIIGQLPLEISAIFANDLRGNKARILLMLALTQTGDLEKIKNFFKRY